MAKDPLHTRLCDMLGIEFPICALTISREVVPEVVNAGGFASLNEVTASPDELAADIKWLRERVNGKPFGINLVMPASAPQAGSNRQLEAQIPAEYREFVRGIKERYRIPDPKEPLREDPAGGIAQDRIRRLVDIALEERVPVLSAGLGSPAWVLEAAHSRGMQVWGNIGRPRHAQREIEAGLDLIIAQGTEAAGHVGEIGTFSLVPAVVAIAGNIPVLAAGGVTTGRGVAAALCLGAAGVWTGTVWVASEECHVDPIIKEKFIKASAEDTVRSRCEWGWPSRTLKTQWIVEWERPEAPPPLPHPQQALLGAPIYQAVSENRVEPFMNMPCGQGVGLVSAVRPARQIVFDMVNEARAVFESLTG